jgi:hypothetical protein
MDNCGCNQRSGLRIVSPDHCINCTASVEWDDSTGVPSIYVCRLDMMRDILVDDDMVCDLHERRD